MDALREAEQDQQSASNDLLAGLDHNSLVLLYTLGCLDDLKKKGLVEGPEPMTEGGRAAYSELKRRGFKPMDHEIQQAMTFLQNGGLSC